MKDFNQAIVMGNLTRDPELRTIPSGQQVASFAVATNRSWMDTTGERKDAVEYHDVVVWGKLAELVNQYLSKGRRVLVVGRLQTRSWEGQDGAKRSKTEIIASDINFVDRIRDNGEAPAAATDGPAEKPKAKAGNKKDEEVNIEDINPDEGFDIDEIPF